MTHADKHLTVAEAAAALHARINERHLPHLHEIEAIVARVVASPDAASTGATSAKASEWRRVLAEERAACAARMQEHLRRKALGEHATEADLDKIADIEAALVRTRATTHAIWGAGATTWDDVLLFAEIARYWQWDSADPALNEEFHHWLEPQDVHFDTQAMAHLVRAVLQMGASEAPAGDHCPRCHAKPTPAATAVRELIPLVQAATVETMRADAAAIERGRASPASKIGECPVWRAALTRQFELSDQLDALVEQVLEEAPSSDRIVVLAQIAQHRACDWPAPYPTSGLGNPHVGGIEAFGDLTMAVLEMAGLSYSAHEVDDDDDDGEAEQPA